MDLREHVARSAELGFQLYLLDKVSAIATDALLATKPDLAAEGIGGYIPLREGTDDGELLPSFLVTFYTRDDPPRSAYQIRVAPDTEPELEAFKPPKPTNSGFADLARARQTAIAAVPRMTQPLNPVVVPGGALGEEGILVYLIAATAQPNVAVFGRHFRVLVSNDGRELLKLTPLSKSELEIPFGKRSDSASLVVTHSLTDHPLETHVLTSLQLGMRVYVGTRRGLWRIEGGAIAFLGNQPPSAAQ